MTKKWGSDVPVSMPEPPPRELPVMRKYGGFGMTEGGITHVVSRADLEEMLVNFFGPVGGDRSGGNPS